MEALKENYTLAELKKYQYSLKMDVEYSKQFLKVIPQGGATNRFEHSVLEDYRKSKLQLMIFENEHPELKV